MANVELGTLYDINKQVMIQTATPLDEYGLSKPKREIAKWFNCEIDGYAMLLCHERRDYTIFAMYHIKEHERPQDIAAQELIDCLKNRGEILSIEFNENKAWEIWLKIDGEAFVYYLFDYTQAVIEC